MSEHIDEDGQWIGSHVDSCQRKKCQNPNADLVNCFSCQRAFCRPCWRRIFRMPPPMKRLMGFEGCSVAPQRPNTQRPLFGLESDIAGRRSSRYQGVEDHDPQVIDLDHQALSSVSSSKSTMHVDSRQHDSDDARSNARVIYVIGDSDDEASGQRPTLSSTASVSEDITLDARPTTQPQQTELSLPRSKRGTGDSTTDITTDIENYPAKRRKANSSVSPPLTSAADSPLPSLDSQSSHSASRSRDSQGGDDGDPDDAGGGYDSSRHRRMQMLLPGQRGRAMLIAYQALDAIGIDRPGENPDYQDPDDENMASRTSGIHSDTGSVRDADYAATLSGDKGERRQDMDAHLGQSNAIIQAQRKTAQDHRPAEVSATELRDAISVGNHQFSAAPATVAPPAKQAYVQPSQNSTLVMERHTAQEQNVLLPPPHSAPVSGEPKVLGQRDSQEQVSPKTTKPCPRRPSITGREAPECGQPVPGLGHNPPRPQWQQLSVEAPSLNDMLAGCESTPSARTAPKFGGHAPPTPVAHIGDPPQRPNPARTLPPLTGHGLKNIYSGIVTGPRSNRTSITSPPWQDQPCSSPQYQEPPLEARQGTSLPHSQAQFQASEYSGPSTPNCFGAQSPAPATTKGLRKPLIANKGIGNPSTPQQMQSQDSRAPSQAGLPTPGRRNSQPAHVGNPPREICQERPPECEMKVGDDWSVTFNPQIMRTLDVSLVHTLQHDSVVCCIRFSHDGKRAATGCNRIAHIFDVSAGHKLRTFQISNSAEDVYVRCISFSPDSKYLATGSEDKLVRVWDTGSGRICNTFAGHEQDVYSLDFASDGRTVASGSNDRTVRLWDIQTGSHLRTLYIGDTTMSVAISPDMRYLATGSCDKIVRVWDFRTGYLLERHEGPNAHKGIISSLAFSANSLRLVSGSIDKTVKMWDLTMARGINPSPRPKGGTCIGTFQGHTGYVLGVALTSDGAWLLSGSEDRGVQFWDPLTGSSQFMLHGHNNAVISVAASPSHTLTGSFFATSSRDMRARIWSYNYIPQQTSCLGMPANGSTILNPQPSHQLSPDRQQQLASTPQTAEPLPRQVPEQIALVGHQPVRPHQVTSQTSPQQSKSAAQNASPAPQYTNMEWRKDTVYINNLIKAMREGKFRQYDDLISAYEHGLTSGSLWSSMVDETWNVTPDVKDGPLKSRHDFMLFLQRWRKGPTTYVHQSPRQPSPPRNVPVANPAVAQMSKTPQPAAPPAPGQKITGRLVVRNNKLELVNERQESTQIGIVELLQAAREYVLVWPHQLPQWRRELGTYKDSLARDQEAFQSHQAQLDKLQAEIRALDSKYDELAQLTPGEQRAELILMKQRAITSKLRETGELEARRDECLTGVQKTTASLQKFEEWMRLLKDVVPSAAKAIEALATQLPNI